MEECKKFWNKYHSKKMALFWNVAPYSLVDSDWHFRGVVWWRRQASNSETSVNIYNITWNKTTEDSHLHIYHQGKLKSHRIQCYVKKYTTSKHVTKRKQSIMILVCPICYKLCLSWMNELNVICSPITQSHSERCSLCPMSLVLELM
jgi:hypothetical protein